MTSVIILFSALEKLIKEAEEKRGTEISKRRALRFLKNEELVRSISEVTCSFLFKSHVCFQYEEPIENTIADHVPLSQSLASKLEALRQEHEGKFKHTQREVDFVSKIIAKVSCSSGMTIGVADFSLYKATVTSTTMTEKSSKKMNKKHKKKQKKKPRKKNRKLAFTREMTNSHCPGPHKS